MLELMEKITGILVVRLAAPAAARECVSCLRLGAAFTASFLTKSRKAPCSHSRQTDVSMSIACRRP